MKRACHNRRYTDYAPGTDLEGARGGNGHPKWTAGIPAAILFRFLELIFFFLFLICVPSQIFYVLFPRCNPITHKLVPPLITIMAEMYFFNCQRVIIISGILMNENDL